MGLFNQRKGGETMKKIGVLLALLLAMGATPGWSVCGPVDSWIDEQAGSDNYFVKTGGMFLRGLHRIIESPVEVGYHTYDGAKNHFGYGEGVLTGLGMGFLWTADGAVRGGWDIITALFPNYHGEPGTHDLGAELRGEDTTTT